MVLVAFPLVVKVVAKPLLRLLRRKPPKPPPGPPKPTNTKQKSKTKLSQEKTLKEGVKYFLFVLMSVSGGGNADFLKPFRKSPALCGVSFKCLVLRF